MLSKLTHRPDTLSSIAGLIAGPGVGLMLFFLLPSSYADDAGISRELAFAARAAAGVAATMAIWWMTEAISIYATALVPLCMFPLLGISDIRTTAASYGHEIIFLFMGGFIIALGIERWELHRRLALTVLAAVGPKPGTVVAAFMAISAFLSMWVSNTATCLMLLPVALSVISLLTKEEGEHQDSQSFAICLLLGIAYSASVGGMGTIVGTAPNIFAVSFIQDQLGRSVSFAEWMTFAVPLVVLFVPLIWLVLTRWIYPLNLPAISGAHELLQKEKDELPELSKGELLTLMIAILTALAWITRPLLSKIIINGEQPLDGLSDTGIAIIGALALFITPVSLRRGEFLMNWATAVRLPWGMLVLFGGGLALAAALVSTGFNSYLGALSAGLTDWSAWAIVLVITAMVVFLTELVSNTAATATLLPVILAVAIGTNLPPLLLIIPATFAASCAFMLPVATPPNAIVFGSGLLRIGQMSRAGFIFNLLAIIVITLATYGILVPILGIQL